MRSITQARGALAELVKLLPAAAERIVPGEGGERTEQVPLAALSDGDLPLIRPGASVPADGVVRKGRSSVNEAMLTGESRPVEKLEGDPVITGTTNGAGSLRIEVTRTGDRTMLASIMRLVEQSQQSRSRAQALADRAAFWLTVIALVAGAVTLAAWLGMGAAPAYAIERLVTVLVIACPHALGLAVPLVVAISTRLGARGGSGDQPVTQSVSSAIACGCRLRPTAAIGLRFQTGRIGAMVTAGERLSPGEAGRVGGGVGWG
jgi:Cu2+-exporting ATPase